MDNVTEWIEHLKHPLVLAGFGLFILALLVKPLFSSGPSNITGAATERLMSKTINYLFILALLLIVVGFVLSLKPNESVPLEKTAATTVIEQHTAGGKSPAIIGNDVNINDGGTLSSQKKTKAKPASPPQKQSPSVNIKQTTQGDKSPAIYSSGDVSINDAE